jgi:hypothetical protein
MSSSRRQSSGDDNILARLERDGKRGSAAKSWKSMNTTIAWCGVASLAVIGLVAVLASLARENVAVRSGPIVVEAKVPADRYTDLEGRSGFTGLPTLASPPRKPQVTVEQPVPSPMLRSTTSRMPPMAMLKQPAAAAAAKPAPAVAAKRPPASPAKLAAAVPAKSAAARAAADRPVAKTPPPKAVVKLAAASGPRIAPAPARPGKAAAEVAAKPESAAIDSDVALLSAIIMHASRHAGERARIAAQTCSTGKKCPAPKATD